MPKAHETPRSPGRQLQAASAPRKHPYLTKIAAFVERLNGATYEVQRSRRHLVVVVTYGEKSHYQTVPSSPSDWRGPARAVSDIRHGLGLPGASLHDRAPAREERSRRNKWGRPGHPARPAHTPWPKREDDTPTEKNDRFYTPLQDLLACMLAEDAAPQAVPPAATLEPADVAVMPRATTRVRLRTPFLGQRRFFQTLEN